MRSLFLLLFATLSFTAAGATKIDAIVNAVLVSAKSKNPDPQKVPSLFPSSLTATEYEEIVRRLKLDRLDLEQIGDKGLTFKLDAIHHALHALGNIPNGGEAVVRLWEDGHLLWDGADSLELCDVAVRRGKEMLPLLSKVTRRKDYAKRCMKFIRNGYTTAF